MPMRLQRPQKQRLTSKELPPELFSVALPKLLANYSTAYRSPKQPPHHYVFRVVQPHHHGGPRPYNVPREAVVPVRRPSVPPQDVPHPFSELVAGHLNPIRVKPILVKLDVRHVERLRNLPGERGLPRARGPHHDDALGIPKAAFSIGALGVDHDATFAVQQA